MLRDGYHKSFRELNVILKLQIDERYRVGSEHPVWDRPLLDQEPEKLLYLCKKLNMAEAAERAADFKAINRCYNDLANYFLLSDDSWLSDYFLSKSLSISMSQEAHIDEHKLAEAHCNLGLAFERSSKLQIQYFFSLLLPKKRKKRK